MIRTTAFVIQAGKIILGKIVLKIILAIVLYKFLLCLNKFLKFLKTSRDKFFFQFFQKKLSAGQEVSGNSLIAYRQYQSFFISPIAFISKHTH